MNHDDRGRRGARRKARTAAARPDRAPSSAVPPAGDDGRRREAFLSLSTPLEGADATPVLHANNPVGSVLLATGVASLASSAASVIGPLLPVGISGFEVRDVLHRFDASVHAPSLERGVTTANRVGEPIGAISIRWLLAPDDFDPTPDVVPPPTEIDSGRSQRFVMRDGLISFQDRSQGGLRFFGAGRTYPLTVANRARLFFAGSAVVLEGVATLKGARGTLLVSGEVLGHGRIALNVVGRLDGDGPVEVADTLGPMFDVALPAMSTALFTLAGSADPDAEGGVEQLTGARIGNDVPNATHLRSRCRVGEPVGTAVGPVTFDETERRCAVRLEGMRRSIAWTDPAGRPVAGVTLDSLEGSSAREERDGRVFYRTVAAGAVAGGTGALTGATGVVAMDTALDASGARSSLYVFRLADPDGRFRASYADAYSAAPPTAVGVPPPSTAPLVFVEGCAVGITDVDRTILSYAERTLADGIELARWWETKDRVGDYAERFDVVREHNPSDRSFGFFDTAVVAGASMPVMGVVQEMFYDRQKMATGETIRAQLEEFVLRYFMRVSHCRQPEAAPAGPRAPQSLLERAISWLPDDEERRVGFGYEQLYYKLRESGRIGKFASDEVGAIVDLREVGRLYDWILLKVDLFDFNLSFAPLGADAPKVQLPLKESTYLVLGPPFVKQIDRPRPGVIATYGFGYAFVPYAPEPGVIAYGPGHFAAAIQTFDFTVMDDGEIRVRAAFVVNRPTRIAAIDVTPVDWGFDLADMMSFRMASRVMGPMKTMMNRLPLKVTGVDPISAYIRLANTLTRGLAEKRYGISKAVLEKRMLMQHFMQHYEMLINSLLIWRTVADWTDQEHLPAYCRTGVTD